MMTDKPNGCVGSVRELARGGIGGVNRVDAKEGAGRKGGRPNIRETRRWLRIPELTVRVMRITYGGSPPEKGQNLWGVRKDRVVSDVITDNKELLAGSFVLPRRGAADVPESMRARV